MRVKSVSMPLRGAIANEDGKGGVAPRPSPLAPVFRPYLRAHILRIGRLAVVVALLLSCLPAPVYAAPPDQTFGGDPLNPFPYLFPDLKQLPAPDWVREGSRTTYYVQSATIAQEEGVEGGGGAGYFHHDIVALTDKNVVISTSMYLDTGNGGVTPSGVYGASVLPGVSDYRVNPAVLADAEQAASEDLVVVHMPTTIADTEYQAVRFEYHTEDGVTIWMFDEDTGVLVYFRHTVGTDADPSRQSSEMYLVNQRQIKLPWQGTRAPTWVKKALKLDYAGARTVLIAGSPSAQLPESATVKITVSQPRWTAFDATAYLGGSPTGQSTRVTGVYQLSNALWLPAEALKATVRKPLLDRDPITGVEVTYTRGANRSVVITESGPLFTIQGTYDGRTGKLLASRIEIQTGLATQITDLQLTD